MNLMFFKNQILTYNANKESLSEIKYDMWLKITECVWQIGCSCPLTLLPLKVC